MKWSKTLFSVLLFHVLFIESVFAVGDEPSRRASHKVSNGASFEALGYLCDKEPMSYASGLSADGQVVVGWTISPQGIEAFRWVDGKMVGLGDLPGGEFSSRAYAVSNDGNVIVGTASTEIQTGPQKGDAQYVPIVWRNGRIEELPRLPGAQFGKGIGGRAFAVSGNGQVIVGLDGSLRSFKGEGFRYEDNLTKEIKPKISRYTNEDSVAWSVSYDGRVVVGGASTTPGERDLSSFGQKPSSHASVWIDNKKLCFIDLPGGGENDMAFGVSGDGFVVVGCCESRNGIEAFRYVDGTTFALGDILGGYFGSMALAASENGDVIVGTGTSDQGEEAFCWTDALDMLSLQELLTHHFGLNLDGWKLKEAVGISADGCIIVGTGINPYGYLEAWRAKLPSLENQELIASIRSHLPRSVNMAETVISSTSPPLAWGNLNKATTTPSTSRFFPGEAPAQLGAVISTIDAPDSVPETTSCISLALPTCNVSHSWNYFLSDSTHFSSHLTQDEAAVTSILTTPATTTRFSPGLMFLPSSFEHKVDTELESRYVIHKHGQPFEVIEHGTLSQIIRPQGVQEVRGPLGTNLAFVIDRVDIFYSSTGIARREFHRQWIVPEIGPIAASTTAFKSNQNEGDNPCKRQFMYLSELHLEIPYEKRLKLFENSEYVRRSKPIKIEERFPLYYWAIENTKEFDLSLATLRVPHNARLGISYSGKQARIILDQGDPARETEIAIGIGTQRGPASLRHSVAGTLSLRMGAFSHYRDGWKLHSSGIDRLESTGDEYGRFDYSIKSKDGSRIFASFILVHFAVDRQITIETSSQLPFSDWDHIESYIYCILEFIDWKQ